MNDRLGFGFTRTVISIAVAMAAAPVLAQNTTAALSGRVAGADGKGVAGVAVSIRHTESGSVNNAVTDAEGRYAVRGLRVGGPYVVTFSKDGQVDKREDVYLALAETTSLDSGLGSAVTQVVITGQGGGASRFNSSNMGSGTNIGSRELNGLASISRSLQDYARTDPRLSQTDKERGEISAAGQNSRFNRITIDGVNISDSFGLESNNLPTIKQPISIDAIQSVQVNISNYDVTQKGYTGANINAVTKSGTNDFHGSVYYVYRSDDLSGQRLNATSQTYFDPPKFKEDTKGITLGGPIIKDKLFFFVSYEDFASSKTSPDFGPIGSTLTNVGITPSAIAGISAIARNTWGFDVGSSDVPSGTETTVKDVLLKLDWNISDNHRANLRYTKTEQSEPFFNNFGARSLSLSSHFFSEAKVIESLVGQWFADWTPTLSTELKLSRRDQAKATPTNARLPAIAFDFLGSVPTGVATGERTLWVGTERSRHLNDLDTKANEGYLGATWTLGQHELKFGGDFSSSDIFNAFLQDSLGQYKFQCESALTYSFGTINCNTATTAEVEAAVLENFRLGRPSSYQAQLPLPGKTINDAVARWTLNNYGVFLQDTWKVSKKLALTLGARVDMTDTPDRPLYNAAASAPMVAGNAATNTAQSGGFGYDNSVSIDGKTLFQPRVGFNLDLGTKERRAQLRGGLGLFEGAAASVWLSNPYSNTGIAAAFYGCGTSGELVSGTGNRAACAEGVFSPDPTKQQALGTNPAPSVDFLDTNVQQPSVWKANLAFDAELPFGGLVAGVEWLHTKTRNGIYYKHLNLGPVTRTGPDGRELYYNANGYDTDCWTTGGTVAATAAGCGGSVASRALSNRSFGNAVLATGTKKGGGDTLTLSLSQQASRALSWSTAYTHSRAKEVSPLTSSVALSNFNGRSIFNPNEEIAANSAYLVRSRVNASVIWSQAFFSSYKTTFGMFYEGRAGKPYSWTFNNDLNGDGLAGNDLMYIPSAPGSGEVVFAGGTADEARFWDVVWNDPEMSRSRGGVVKRNGSRSPFVNSFDVRMSQEVPGFTAGHKGVFTVDILNIGNLIDKRWGRTDEVGFQSAGAAARSFVNYKGMTADGKYIYSTFTTPESLITRQARGESQWAIQVTLKYEF
ncbi:TonB-dependent receptor [Aquabacterium sp.]|uniref:TonB-dependent receptor n=1 Tax=Aquabacterium sp. TaxID=1872578 RepID=UPI002BAB83D7|nr:TonB-dependent receptor [Aquabacterium sp.]HSW09261.1 TonB-dependent receptor [Aquabacterium sp.]